ncbi:MAG: hypothetical protein ACR2NG_05825 [Acidimicrobiia bacterium]
MFTRLRWFAYGSAVTLGATVVVVSRARAMRERLDAQGVARVSANVAADGIEMVGKRLQRSSLRVAPMDEGPASDNG